MTSKEISHKDFLKFVDYMEIDHVEYVDKKKDLDLEGNKKPLSEFENGGLYVTWGDEKPWLQVSIKSGHSFALKPELALYWLERIKKFYDSLSETKIEEGNE